MDILSDTLDALQITGSIYGRAEFTAPWGLRIDGQSNHAGFIYAVRGTCYIKVAGRDEMLVLSGGDFFMTPPGTTYSFKSSPDVDAVSIMDMPQPCEQEGKRVQYGGGGAMTTLILGCFSFETASKNPLLEAFPDLIYVKAEQLESEPALEMILRLIVAEISSEKPGSFLAINRLTDLLFVNSLRFAIRQSEKCPSTKGLLKALSDPQIGTALNLIHEKPYAPWTVSTLAEAAQMSRSSFAVKFSALTSKTPLEYVTTWRMNKAQQLLLQGKDNLAKIASDIGYQSEAAFSKAFRRETGVAPGTFRRQSELNSSHLGSLTPNSQRPVEIIEVLELSDELSAVI